MNLVEGAPKHLVIVHVQNLTSVGLPEFESGMKEPKSLVLPITPQPIIQKNDTLKRRVAEWNSAQNEKVYNVINLILNHL